MSMPDSTVANFTQLPDSTGENTESPGAWLARIRVGAGLELREVAQQLRLNPTIIQAIEADDFARLGPPVFVRGYLSRYAQLLELPEAGVLEHYRRQTDTASQVPTLKVVLPIQRQTRVRDLRGLFYLLVIGGIGWAAVEHLDDLDPGRLTALWAGNHSSSSPSIATPTIAAPQIQYPFQSKPAETVNESPVANPPPTVEPAPVHPDPDLAPAIAAEQPSLSPAVDAASTPAASGTGTAPAAPVLAVSGMGTAPAVPTLSVNTTSPDSSGAGAKLLLEFSNDCWVEVKDAQGNILASGMMRANTTHTLSGVTPFKVTLGNAPAARIIFDDRLVDTTVYIPRRGTVSRFTLDRGDQP